MKRLFLYISVFVIIAIVQYSYKHNYNYYESGAKDKFDLKIGQEFTIKFSANGSTGYRNCWINENKCNFIKNAKKKYYKGLSQMIGYIGAGGTEAWTFKAVARGIDTIIIESCPPIPNKGCEYFSIDSIRNENSTSNESERGGNYTFIVNVSE